MGTRNSSRKVAWIAGAGSGRVAEQAPVYPELRQAIAALKAARLRAGLSLTETARRSGIDLAALSRLENGHHANPTPETLARYAGAIGKRLAWVIQDDPSCPWAAVPAESATPNERSEHA